MKKLITLSTILALSVASVVEAKGMRSSRSVSGRTISAPAQPMKMNSQQKTNTQQQTQHDATFDNTRSAQTAQPQAQAQQAGSNRLASFATGAAAGYVLSEMLTPSAAQANQTTQQAAQPATQAVEKTADVANAQVAQFKSIGGQIDPFLIEKTDGYRRYCIEGVQYLIPALAGQTVQAAPVVMVKPNGSPLECRLLP
ncbi:hypothetical protein O3795_00765 [Haemophilus parahaemolyticus]|uniref:hypothetical protein n=1 Tax=Haemophilus parahaemolyticus TaxID=735 RepID=UPI00058C6C7D|nr:hypothetical protein [Haemophilus parahaemolyticus]